MSLVVFTGGARSGKSSAALDLVSRRSGDVVVVVAAHSDEDTEMARRIDRHRADRPAHFTTLEVHEGALWLADVSADAVLLVDCLGTLVGQTIAAAFASRGETARSSDVVSPDIERDVEDAVRALVNALLARGANTVIVTNEVGDGIVPAFPDARLFRDVLGRANQRLVSGADAAYLVVAGRCVELTGVPRSARWPGEEAE
jgi:adenosylcobinamide kinase/adenosylcobinamide-phosphate guanylyltransferase